MSKREPLKRYSPRKEEKRRGNNKADYEQIGTVMLLAKSYTEFPSQYYDLHLLKKVHLVYD